MIDEEKKEILKSTEKLWNERNRLKELEKENERLKGIDAIEINGLRFNSPFEMIKWIGNAQFEIKELKAQIEELKTCWNCKKEFTEDCETCKRGLYGGGKDNWEVIE